MPEIKRADGGTENVSEEDLEAAAEFYDKIVDISSSQQLRIRFWTKKLDEIHIEVVPRSPQESAGLCGKPLLGGDYFQGDRWKNIDKAVGRNRGVCVECALELQRRLNAEYTKFKEIEQNE